MESGRIHPVFEGILRGVMAGQNDYFAARYERKETAMDEGQELARDRAEAIVEARRPFELTDAMMDDIHQDCLDDALDEARAEARDAED